MSNYTKRKPVHEYFCVHAVSENIVKEIYYVVDIYNLIPIKNE